MLVTVERYLKVVHRTVGKKILTKCVLRSAAAFSWAGGFALSIGITITTTDVVDGLCYSYVFWSSYESDQAAARPSLSDLPERAQRMTTRRSFISL